MTARFMLADVIVFRGVPLPYTYRVPADLSALVPGTHVTVPVGKSRAKGLVISVRDASESEAERFRDIEGIDPKSPVLPPDMVALILWFAQYYQATPYKAYQTVASQRKLRDISSTEGDEAEGTPPDYELTAEQQHVIDAILATEGYREALIHGVTASGKTEIYMQLASALIRQGRSMIMMVPEIALTPQFTRQFTERFGSRVAVIHSGFTPKERDIAWQMAYEGRVSIVLGPRSAVFSPLPRLGLVVIDEEHEPSYKQENHPRYFTHTVAQFRCRQHGAALVFGSATPSLETYYGIVSDKKNLLFTLTKRVRNLPMPAVKVADMKEVKSLLPGSIFSPDLTDALRVALRQGEKAMLLLNRRGFAPFIRCRKCGEVYTCSQCQLSFTYHKDRKFRCHRCDVTLDMHHTCPHCKANQLTFEGLGIQKAETELRRLFPDAVIYRLDRDIAPTAKKMEAILKQFRSDGQILIGTQLIAKGHHFEDVTVVGVLGIDTILNLPDFRSPERAFQLLSQVAGRSGRGRKTGEVIIQTFEPEHYAIRYAAAHDYAGFYESELHFREKLGYPPFSRLINIIVSSKFETAVIKYFKTAAVLISEALRPFGDRVRILGPKPAPLEMVREHYRWHMLLKCAPEVAEEVKEVIWDLPPHPRYVRVIKDFDPRSIL